jgi:hypothetical protein
MTNIGTLANTQKSQIRKAFLSFAWTDPIGRSSVPKGHNDRILENRGKAMSSKRANARDRKNATTFQVTGQT